MSATDIQIAICGSAGDGTIAAGSILNQAMARAGYKVIAFDVYPGRDPRLRRVHRLLAHHLGAGLFARRRNPMSWSR